jgi:hypothetical protein
MNDRMDPRQWLRAIALATVALATATLVAGCFTLDMDLQVRADDTVDGSVVLAVDKEFAERAGGEDAFVDSLTSGDSSLFGQEPSAGTVEARRYSAGSRVGVEFLLSGVPVSDFGRGTADDLSIVRVGDTFVVSGVIDVRQGLADAGSASERLLRSAEIRLSIGFPGDVVSSNGDVDGKTVTWTPDATEPQTISAVGKAANDFPWALVIGGMAVVGLAAVVLVVMLQRGRGASSR